METWNGLATWFNEFNNNIRCIEMRLARGDTVDQGTFNNNIRCIEIS